MGGGGASTFPLLSLLSYSFCPLFFNPVVLSCRYNFRNQNFDIPRFNSVLYGKHSLRHLGPFLWNKLDKNITETYSLSRFKFHIRSKDLTELINGNNIAPRAVFAPFNVCPCS